jgi:hypothetical protein
MTMRGTGSGFVMIRSVPLPRVPSKAAGCLLVAIFLLLQNLPSAARPAPLAQSLELSADGGFIILAELEGRAVRLRVDPASGGILLNLSTARRLGISDSGSPLHALVGPVRVDGRARRGRLAIGGWRGRRPVRWFDRDIVPEADGLIGLNELPYRMTTLHLRPGRPGRRALVFAVEPSEYYGLVYRQRFAGETLDFVFGLRRPETLATAAAGAHLARHFSGAWLGDAFMAPATFSVVRPLRRMAFATPVAIGDLRLAAMLVRTADFRGGFVLPEDASADPSEIVVTGRQARSRARLTVALGSDQLSRCSSIQYDNLLGRLTIYCDP